MIYKFTNVNPLGKLEEDCVCRAISNALQIDYYEIEEKLNLVGALFNCEKLCVCCYTFLLDYVFNLRRDESYAGMTIEEFINYNRKGTFIIRVEGHLTMCRNGFLEDIWDCRRKIVDLVWEVSR